MNINKSSGTLNLAGVLTTANNWTYTTGTVSPGTSKVVFIGSLTITGSHTLYDIDFYPIGIATANYTIAAGIILTSSGTIRISGSAVDVVINTGTLEAKGDVTITNSGTYGGGTGTLLIDGTGNQTMTGPGNIGEGKLPKVTINKSAGTLNLASVTTVTGDWTYTTGTISPGTSKIALMGTLTVTGSHTLYNIEFYPAAGTSTYTIAAGTTFTSSGTLTISGSAADVVINTGTVEAKVDVITQSEY